MGHPLERKRGFGKKEREGCHTKGRPRLFHAKDDSEDGGDWTCQEIMCSFVSLCTLPISTPFLSFTATFFSLSKQKKKSVTRWIN